MDLRHSVLNSWLCLVMLQFLNIAFSLGQNELYRCENGILEFSSDAPLEMISAKSEVLRGIIDPAENTFAFTVEIRSFLGFNSDLQRTHFNENYLESPKFPKASFLGKIIENMDWNSPGDYHVRAKGQLNIHGIKQERIIPALVRVLPGTVVVEAAFTVPLAEHDIQIPKIVAQKIAEIIAVRVSATLGRQTAN